MISTLPVGWTVADLNAWFAPISTNAIELRDEYVLSRTPKEIWVNTNEYLAIGATTTPLPVAWSMQEFIDWVTALIANATLAYYAFIISSTPPPLQSAIKERINYQQPPPTNDLINGGNSGLPGTPGVPGTLPPGSTLTRASGGTYWKLVSSVPTLTQAAVNEARFTVNATTGAAEGLRNEPAATNQVRNASAAGAVLGTADNPAGSGTPPTFWQSNASAATVARNVVATGIEDGIPYIDMQFVGTPTGNNIHFVAFESSNVIASLQGQVWTSSLYCRLVSGTLTNALVQLLTTERNNLGGSIGTAGLAVLTPTNAALRTQRTNLTATIGNALTVFSNPQVIISFTLNLPINLTLRFGLSQYVQGPIATSAIITTNAALTREVDIFNVATPNGTSDMVVTRVSGATTYPGQVITTGKWRVPTDPSPVKTVAANVVAAAMPIYDFMATPGLLPPSATLNRPTTGWAFSTPNGVRNPTIAGASVSPANPGTLPTNWFLAGTRGTLQTELSTVTVDGITCLRFRTFGTTSSTTFGLYFEGANVIAALTGQSFTESFRVALSAGSLANISSVQHYVVERASSTAFIKGNQTNITLTGTLSPFSSAVVLSGGATTAFVQPGIIFNFASGVNIDITIDVGFPMLMNTTPLLTSFANDLPRWRANPTSGLIEGLLNEPPALCSLINASGLGATGTTTPPTGWATSGNLASLTRTYTQVVEDGIPAVDIKITGTPNNAAGTYGTASMFFGAATEVAALPGQTWTGSLFCRLSTGTLAPPNTTQWVEFFVREANAAGGLLPDLDTLQLTPTSAPLRTQRTDITHKVVNAAAAMLRPYLLFVYTGGVPVDFTVRVFPQLVKAPAATSPIITTNAAVTRGSDILVCQLPNPVPGFWDVTVKRASGTTVVSGIDLTSGVGTSYAVPVDPSPVQSVKFALS